MQLAFSTNAYLNHSFADAVTQLAGLGYRGVEIMADVPHAWPAYLLPEQKQAIRDALARNNLAISNVNSFMMHAVNDHRQKYWHPSWIEPDANYRRVRIDHTKRALTLAKELGARCITTEPGGPLEGQSRIPIRHRNADRLTRRRRDLVRGAIGAGGASRRPKIFRHTGGLPARPMAVATTAACFVKKVSSLVSLV